MRISDWSSDVCSSDLQDIGLGAVGIVDQRDEGGAVGVIFQTLDRALDVPQATLEVDDAVALLVTAGDAARGHMTLVVAAAGLALAFSQRLDGLALVQRAAVDEDQAALGGAGRVVALKRHGQRTPSVMSIDWPSARRTIAFLTSERV